MMEVRPCVPACVCGGPARPPAPPLCARPRQAFTGAEEGNVFADGRSALAPHGRGAHVFPWDIVATVLPGGHLPGRPRCVAPQDAGGCRAAESGCCRAERHAGGPAHAHTSHPSPAAAAALPPLPQTRSSSPCTRSTRQAPAPPPEQDSEDIDGHQQLSMRGHGHPPQLHAAGARACAARCGGGAGGLLGTYPCVCEGGGL